MILYRNNLSKVARSAHGILRHLAKVRLICYFINANQRSVEKLHMSKNWYPYSAPFPNFSVQLLRSHGAWDPCV